MAKSESMTKPLEIAVANEQALVAIDEESFVDVARRILRDGGVRGGSLSIAVVDDDAIHRLNREFLNHDYPTDVLSFTLDEDPSGFEGEIVVSAETAIRNAANYGWSTENELNLYIIHGALHLAGYRDKMEADQAEMREAESKYLRLLGIERPPCPDESIAAEPSVTKRLVVKGT